jgi:Na+-translocating ferredoxin:NAD+ oxidoreductase RNF subunit RnfB
MALPEDHEFCVGPTSCFSSRELNAEVGSVRRISYVVEKCGGWDNTFVVGHTRVVRVGEEAGEKEKRKASADLR